MPHRISYPRATADAARRILAVYDNCDSPATLATMLAMKGRRTFIDERKQRGLKPQ